MKSVDFTVQRLIDNNSDSDSGGLNSDAGGERDHVTSDDDVINCDVTAGARGDECEDELGSSRSAHHAAPPLLIHPSLYLDYARQFLWHLSAAYRPGQFTNLQLIGNALCYDPVVYDIVVRYNNNLYSPMMVDSGR